MPTSTASPLMQLVSVLALGLSAAPAAAQTIGTTFQSSTSFSALSSVPDSTGAVGPAHYVELINFRYAVHRKSDGVLLQSSTLDQFFTAGGVVPQSYAFDPRILFDAQSGRWFAAAADNPVANNRILFAVSDTADPTQGWTAFGIDPDLANTAWADFPTMGVCADAVVISANMYGFGGGVTNTILVIPKAPLLAPTPSVATLTRFQTQSGLNLGYSVQPAVTLDGAGLPLTLLSDFNLAAGNLKLSRIGGTALAPTLITAGGFITVPALAEAPDAPQPALPTQKPPLEAGTSRFSGSVVRRGGSLWGVQAVATAGRAAIHWIRINDATGAVQQRGVLSHPTLSYLYPSIAVNEFGDAVIGCSASSSSQPASSYAIVGQTTGGITTFAAPILTRAGLDDFQALDGFGRNRWGDYSATTVDPVNPRRFWTVQQFVLADDVWAHQVTEIITGPVCPTFTTQPAPITVRSGQRAQLTSAASGDAPLSYQWFRGPSAVTDGGAVSGASTATLVIDPVALTDDGFYLVQATNACGTTPTPSVRITVLCATDINQSGASTVQDIYDFLAQWQFGNITADFNRSGAVTVQDIYDFLSAWNAGCI